VKQDPGINHCRLCGVATRFLWLGRLLDHDVTYWECPACSYVQTEEPFWLDQAYSEAINDSDTGIMSRNLANARIVPIALMLMGNFRATVVDYAGGYGILVRLLRDYGIEAFWTDPYCINLVSRGFEYAEGKAGLVTAFECFEHFIHPGQELGRMLEIAPNVLVSTLIMPSPTPKMDDWWYYGRETGQHIGFFRVKTLKWMAEKHGKFLATDGRGYHLFSDKPVNHMLWKVILRSNKALPLSILRYCRSLTWTDHVKMSSPGRRGSE